MTCTQNQNTQGLCPQSIFSATPLTRLAPLALCGTYRCAKLVWQLLPKVNEFTVISGADGRKVTAWLPNEGF